LPVIIFFHMQYSLSYILSFTPPNHPFHWKTLKKNLATNSQVSIILIKCSIKVDQSWSKSIKADQSWSKSIKVDQSWSKSIKVDQSRSKSIKVDQSRSKPIKVDQSRSKSIKVDLSDCSCSIVD
jgi:hypothetical protein